MNVALALRTALLRAVSHDLRSPGLAKPNRRPGEPGNVRHATVSGRPGDEPHGGSASPDLQMRSPAGHRRDGCLNHASPTGDALERAIPLAGRAPDRLRGIKDRVAANGARSDQSLLHFRQFGVEEAAIAGQEEVRKPELVDPFTLPGLPDLVSPRRRRLGVSFQDRHLVAIPAQQKPGTKADDPSTHNHDLGDGDPPSQMQR